MDGPERIDAHGDADLLALVALGEPSHDPAFDAHLERCASCRASVDELRAVVAAGRSVTRADVPATPPPTLWEGVAAAIRKDEPAPVSAPARVTRIPRRRLAVVAAVAAAVVVAGAVVVTDPVHRTSRSTVATSDIALEPVGSATARGEAVMVASRNGSTMTVDVPGLPDEAGGFYEVWLMASTTQLVSLGVLDRKNHGSFPVPAGLDVAKYAYVDVSLESLDGDPGHSGDSVARGRLPA